MNSDIKTSEYSKCCSYLDSGYSASYTFILLDSRRTSPSTFIRGNFLPIKGKDPKNQLGQTIAYKLRLKLGSSSTTLLCNVNPVLLTSNLYMTSIAEVGMAFMVLDA